MRTCAALSVASHGYIMEQGKVVLDGHRRQSCATTRM